MTDETPATSQTRRDSQPDHTYVDAHLGPVSAAQSTTSSAAPQRAAKVTTPLSAHDNLEESLFGDALDTSGAQDRTVSGAQPGGNSANGANGAAHDEPAPEETLAASASSVEDTPTEPVTQLDAGTADAEDTVSEPEVVSSVAPQAPEQIAETTETEQTPESPVAETAPARTDRARDAEFARYYAVRTHIGPIAFSPDLTQVAYITNTSGQFNIWRQSVSGGWPSQVTTFEDESARSLIWAPNGEIIGATDHAGGEQYDLFSIPATGGVVRYLTDQPDAQYELSEEGLSPDGRYLVYSGNDRTPTDGDVLIRDMRTGETRRALANGHYNVAINWSPDSRYVTVMDIRSNTDMRLWLLEAESGEARELAPHDDECYLAPGPWLPDSSGLYLITDRGSDYKGIARYMLADDTIEWVLTPEWDVEQVALSADGRRLLWTLNESGRSQLHIRDNEQASLRVSGLPIGVIEYMKLSPDGQTLALRINSATAPAEVYILTLGAVGMVSTPHLRRLTFGMLGGLDPAELIAPELVRYRTFDGREIPAWLYRPKGASAMHPAPLVLSIHGGPEAQERVEYRALYQFLLARGIGVLAPNIRGSTGYGKAYQKLIHRDWGGGELKDIEAAAEYAGSLSWVNPRKLGVYGGSFGGFATLSAVTRLPDHWAAAVDIVGPSNLLTFVRSVPPTWRRMMAAWVGDPEEDADLLRERSPITYVEQTRAPLLVLQGANDPRVVKAESDQMVETLRATGRDVEYVIFPDEGHGFTKRVNLLRAYSLTADFFERHLL
ncbi:MAG TPA: prolyl oligopeptidase family serine peptidase [Ktedonobacterales bacterium]|nr:prolyl oligopeptidase family serine peptidase [Ktedonobacterales bacterium]